MNGKNKTWFSAFLFIFSFLLHADIAVGQEDTIHRFDIDIREFPYLSSSEQDSFILRYQPVVTRYVSRIIPDDTLSTTDKLKTFANQTNIKFFFDGIDNTFPNLDKENKMLSKLKENYEHSLAKKFPVIYSIISPYNQSVLLLDTDAAAIALNHYLGENYKPYSYFPKHIRMFKTPAKLPFNLIESILRTEYPYRPDQDNLMERMLYEGIIKYAALQLLQIDDVATCCSFTDEQLQWCEQNRTSIFKKVFDDGLYQKSDPSLFESMLSPAPFSAPISPDSPGEIGKWIGLQLIQKIVSSQQISIRQLLENEIYRNTNLFLMDYSYEQ